MSTMDYIFQVEKIFKFLEFNLDFQEAQLLMYIKRRFNNDLNLFGCFIKDYIIVNTLKIPDDNELYDDFVLFFLKNSSKDNIKLLDKYSQCYLSIVFEDCDNEDILEAITTANACFMMEAYPALMKILYNYYHQKIDVNILQSMLQFTKDYVINKFDSQKVSDFEAVNFLNNLVRISSGERLVG